MRIEQGILIEVNNRDIVNGTFIIPDSVTSIGSDAFIGCGLTSVTIPDSVTSIGSNAFYNCRGLTSVTIPDSVTSIGSDAFLNCSGLTSVTIGNSVTSIGMGAFFGCSGLTSVTIGNSVTSIGSDAFLNCSGLTSVTIPDSVTSIGNLAFYGCSGLTNITIPDGVTSIGRYAFEGCSGLTSKKANYKAFCIKNRELYCRGKKYIECVENSVQGALKMCENGIHYCTNLFEIFNYYSGELDKDIAIYEIEVGNNVLTSHTSKCCTNSCILKKRLYKEDIIKILNTEGDNE